MTFFIAPCSLFAEATYLRSMSVWGAVETKLYIEGCTLTVIQERKNVCSVQYGLKNRQYTVQIAKAKRWSRGKHRGLILIRIGGDEAIVSKKRGFYCNGDTFEEPEEDSALFF